MTRTFHLRLTTGVTVEVTAAHTSTLVKQLRGGTWPVDKYGWRINPAHVVMVRPDEDGAAL